MLEQQATWLKPFEDRAAKAEERLARLEAALASYGNTASLQVQPPAAAAAQAVPDNEEKAQLLTKTESLAKERDGAMNENQKLRLKIAQLEYQNTHLIRAVRHGDKDREVLAAKVEELQRSEK